MRIKKFKEYLLEDVGDKYAEKKFNIPQKFTEFDKQYRRRYNDIGQQIIYRDKRGVVIIKNPGSLESIGPWTRGVIDLKGNLFIEQESLLVHDQIIRILNSLGLIKYNITTWHVKDPNASNVGFITVQRQDDGNIMIGESNIWWRDKRDDATPIFQVFLDKAKIKNPNITFENILINTSPYIFGVDNIPTNKLPQYNQIKNENKKI